MSSSWKGKLMMNPKGKIGKVINDDNTMGMYRILTVKFDDGTIQDLELNNVGQNSNETKEWSWQYINNEGKKSWVKWGY
jgi:hypothetical protein